ARPARRRRARPAGAGRAVDEGCALTVGPSPDGGPPPAALVVTQVALPEALAAACALQRVEVDVVPTPVGCVAVGRDVAEGAPAAVARAITSLLPGVPALLLEQRDGRVAAARWSDGAEA